MLRLKVAGKASVAATTEAPKKDAKSRAFSGLVLVFLLSFLSLAGILLTIASIGGLGNWSRWQFIGLFGVIEAASGIANIVAPNIWRLPVVELTSDPAKRTKLALSTVLIPHWGGAARTLAGLALIVAAASQEGVGPATIALAPFVFLLALLMLCLSALIARAGVASPHYDAIQVTIKYAKQQHEVEPVSLSASALQFVFSIMTIPIVKTLAPGVLYQPEIGPSQALLIATALLASLLAGATFVAWRNRVDWQAPIWQQREAERNA